MSIFMQPSVSEIQVLALLGCYAAYVRNFFTDVSGQFISSIVKGQTIQEFLGLFDPRSWKYWLSLNVGKLRTYTV